jgi:hypothetical protein
MPMIDGKKLLHNESKAMKTKKAAAKRPAKKMMMKKMGKKK